MTTLAQANPLAIPAPQPLPGVPLWEWALLENAWVPAVAVMLIGVILATRMHGARRGLVVGVAALLAVGVVVLDRMVETGREAMRASVRRLVTAVTSGNASATAPDLDPQARLFSYLHRNGIDRDEILRQIEQKLRGGEWAVRDPAILELQATQDGPEVGRVQVKVRVQSDAAGTPIFSWWALDYRLEGTWRAVRIEPLAISLVGESRAR